MNSIFDDFVLRAAGCPPYGYQRRLAEEGLPDVLRVPTGAGKTMAAVLPWLYRRRHHPDLAVRRGTPRRLVFVLPQRALVEQTVDVIDGWLTALDESEIGRYILMGGVDRDDRAWKMHPEQDAIFVGTQDMILSRLLMRGYAEPRANWPMSFGLLHSDTQFVFDEVQLMGPALPTSLQMQGLRAELGTALPCRSMWMSATLDVPRLGEVAPDLDPDLGVVELSEDDRTGPLRVRLDATRRLERIEIDGKRYARELSSRIVSEHRPATRTLVVLNTVDRATEVFDAVTKLAPAADLVLLHSRYRPPDRAVRTKVAIAAPGAAGTIVVSTQVLEAGMDITSELLVTELAPWSSIVQRSGRCNRDGCASDARILWTWPPSGLKQHLPYKAEQLEHTSGVLAALEGEDVTSSRMQEAAQDLDPPVHPVLRRRDLLDLFDTAPDLDGNDIDVSQWIRDADDRTAFLAWRAIDTMDETAPYPARDELCPAPLGDALRELVTKRQARTFDHRDGRWRSAVSADVRLGAVIVLDAASGGYLPDRGFSPKSTDPVPTLPPAEPRPVEAVETDPLSQVTGPWVPLSVHLADVERESARLLRELDPSGITMEQRTATELAGRYHDLGKAHPTFEASLRAAAAEDPVGIGPWAKSPGRGALRHKPRFFRHELVSALLLTDGGVGLLDDVAEPDLVGHLVLAHHGKVRLSVRARPEEQQNRVLGVTDGDMTLDLTLPDGRTLPARSLSLEPTRMGVDGLTARALRLRDRPDLGPFRLAFLEAVVRAADWIASASYETEPCCE
ncbi:MAG: CRISPR-associated helicase Cas3' [Actinomycetota bacterium]|nr:CRISPR-associated helicase Cas3' [Actinomycetota bacterium]